MSGLLPGRAAGPLDRRSARQQRDVIRTAVRAGMARRAEIKPFRVTAPIELEVRFKDYRPAEVLSYLPGVRRADAHAMRFTARDMPEVARLLSFITQYQPTLEP